MTKLWDLVSQVRVKPVIPAAIGNTAKTALVNQASVDRATTTLDNYNDAYNAAASLIINTTSDAQMYYVRSVIEDLVATWKRLRDKFERKTKLATEVAQLQLPNFQHIETKTAYQTIERFEFVLCSLSATRMSYLNRSCAYILIIAYKQARVLNR